MVFLKFSKGKGSRFASVQKHIVFFSIMLIAGVVQLLLFFFF